MSHLLVKDTFEKFYLSEASIKTANSYTISGEVNKDFYTDEEYSSLSEKKYSLWHDIKPFCFQLIKGSHVPSYMKLVFLLSDSSAAQLIEKTDTGISPDDVNGLFLNIKYADGTVNIVTGTSIKIFTLDKSLEQAFDRAVKAFLSSNGINYEEI
jgi:hypothetical protein